MNEPRALAKLAAAAQRCAESMSAMQRIATDGRVELAVARQTIAMVEEYDLLRFRLREATLRGVIEPAPATIAARIATAPATRKSPAKRKAKR
jgi:hypothetical protein